MVVDLRLDIDSYVMQQVFKNNLISIIKMSYNTYVTTWGRDPLDLVNDMIAKGVLKKNVRVILAFASFNFTDGTYIPGFGSLTIDKTKQIVNLVHANNGKISLSIGGATYPFYGSDLYTLPGFLAGNINTILNTCGFDGVDFDVEDSSVMVPSNFAETTASLINTLRSLNSGLYISLTTPAQAWGAGMYQKSLLDMVIGNIDVWQPMEYDLWIESGSNYAAQIEFDINYYMSAWGVNPVKMVLGLMPGDDDLGHNLSLQDTLNLTSYVLKNNLAGVMAWDADIDSQGVDGNAHYAYSLGIESMIGLRRRRFRKYVKKMGISK